MCTNYRSEREASASFDMRAQLSTIDPSKAMPQHYTRLKPLFSVRAYSIIRAYYLRYSHISINDYDV